MNTSFLKLEINNVPPIKGGSCSNTIKYLDKWRTDVSRLLLVTCAKCDDFLTCSKDGCEIINDKIKNMQIKIN